MMIALSICSRALVVSAADTLFSVATTVGVAAWAVAVSEHDPTTLVLDDRADQPDLAGHVRGVHRAGDLEVGELMNLMTACKVVGFKNIKMHAVFR